MKNLIESIVDKDFDTAKEMFEESIDIIVGEKLVEMKKMIMAKEQRQAWTGMPGSRQEKLYRGVIEEDDLEEMDLSKEKPDYKSIEDKRSKGLPFFMSNVNKNSFPNSLGAPKPKSTQTVNTTGKGDLQKEETEELDEARVNIVKARILGGKIQRRKKVSNVPGMTIRGGKLTRMSPAERRRRKLGQRKGKIKRRAKMARALMKRKRSIQRRKSLGLR